MFVYLRGIYSTNPESWRGLAMGYLVSPQNSYSVVGVGCNNSQPVSEMNVIALSSVGLDRQYTFATGHQATIMKSIFLTKQHLLIQVLLFIVDAVCLFPTALQNSEWILKYYKPTTNETRNLIFGLSSVSNWLIIAQGDKLDNYTCVSQTENVYVLK